MELRDVLLASCNGKHAAHKGRRLGRDDLAITDLHSGPPCAFPGPMPEDAFCYACPNMKSTCDSVMADAISAWCCDQAYGLRISITMRRKSNVTA